MLFFDARALARPSEHVAERTLRDVVPEQDDGQAAHRDILADMIPCFTGNDRLRPYAKRKFSKVAKAST